MTFKNLLLVLILASITVLGIAYFVEYVLKIPPCQFCVYQRIVFMVLLAISIILYFIRYYTWHSYLVISILSLSLALAVYHTLIERKVIGSNSKCSSESAINNNFDGYKQSIYNKSIVSCDQVLIKFIGLSMAEWNIVYSFMLLSFSIIVIRREQK